MLDRLRQAFLVTSLAGPAALAMLVLIFVPTAVVAVISFSDWTLGAPSLRWVGLDNYAEILSDRAGRAAVINTLIYVGVVMPSSVLLGLLVALGIRAQPVGQSFFRAAYFLPVASTFVAMTTVWQMVLHPTLGPVNTLLGLAGLPEPDWLSDRGLVLYTLALLGIWETVGYNMVLFLAGLSAIPQHLYDAAEVDGARSGWSRFWTVTWPMLGPTLLFVVTITAIRSFRVFESVAALTDGGPGHATEVLVFALYREGFEYFRAGYAGALTMVFFFFILTLTLLQVRVLDRRVHYR